MKFFFSFILIFSVFLSFSQKKIEGVKNPKDQYKKCKRCFEAFNEMPKEVSFGLEIQDDKVYFLISDHLWFDKIFQSSKDGIAVDLIARDMFPCGKPNKLATNWLYEGQLIKPVYKKEMKENIVAENGNSWKIFIADVPKKLRGQEIEPLMLLLQKKNLCQKIYFYSIPSYRWELLPMGLYKEKVVYKDSLISAFQTSDSLGSNNKTMDFVFGFEKDKYDYSPEDLKPLYDSLKLTDYNIQTITIKAYSSVEGPEERNIRLQENRAASIVSALQAYQKPEIKTNISAEENWEEFFNDIKGTRFSHYADKSKQEIKDSLHIDAIEAQFDYLLKTHRKALLSLYLERKDSLFLSDGSKLLNQLKIAVKGKELTKAEQIQNALYNQIVNSALPSELADSLELPDQKSWWQMFNNQYIYETFYNSKEAKEVLQQYLHLDSLLPNKKEIKYNICALRFDLWTNDNIIEDSDAFFKEIKALTKLGVSQQLVTRMLINFNILKCEEYMDNRQYKLKDKAMRFIYSNYRKAKLEDSDILNVAQYFVSYGDEKTALKIVQPRISSANVTEELVFYYLNLTIADEKRTRSSKYKKVLTKALSLNKERFCKIFSTDPDYGITFQLLREPKLKKFYCEKCMK